jgi:hypothetical protein
MIGFTCCVNYSDFLAATYPHNRKYFDRFIVVTSPDDIKTHAYCEANGIKLILSNAYKKDGSTFNRAAMLNVAIDYIQEVMWSNDWAVSIDVDVIIDIVDDSHAIVSDKWVGKKNPFIATWADEITATQPGYFTETYLSYKRNKGKIYGCPRKMITEPHPDGIDHYRKPDVGEWFDYPYNLSAYLGYFQMFHTSTGARNDESYKTVDNSDTAFVDRNFGINNCRVLSDVVCYHLGANGVNWNGRVSKEWK